MGEAKLYGKSGGGLKIDGIIADYYAYAGENINTGDFVEFVNGVASTTTVTSSDTAINEKAGYGFTISACKLTENKVFIAHGTSATDDNSLLYGIVCIIDGVTITKGTETRICATSYSGAKISAVALSETSVFIAHSYGSSYYLRAVVAKIDGTTITAGTDTSLATSGDGFTISACKLTENKVFIAHGTNLTYSNSLLYGVVCTIDGVTINSGTETKICGVYYTGAKISAIALSETFVFIAHSYESSYYLYAVVATINGTTITAGSDTSLSTTTSAGNEISVGTLENGNIFVAHVSDGTNMYLNGIICTVNGTTITKGTDTLLGNRSYNGRAISLEIISNGNVFIACSENSNYYWLDAIICSVSETTITKIKESTIASNENSGYTISTVSFSNETVFIAHSRKSDYQLYGTVRYANDTNSTFPLPTYETQVRKASSKTINGVAKTSGIGGDSTAHGDKVSVYVPNI